VPRLPAAGPAIERQGEDLVMRLGDRHYRIQLLEQKPKAAELKVALLVTRGEYQHVDKFDLYVAPKRTAYIHQAAIELGVSEDVIKADLGRIFRALEQFLAEQRKAALASNTPATTTTAEEREAALELLRDPRLLDRLLEGFRNSGVAGEETNLLVGYLAAVSRLLDKPMAIVIQSSSAAGKSALLDAILAFLPAEHKHKYSAMTGQSLFYMGEVDLQHKVLAIVEEEGAERATYALKLLQSEGELSIASTGKDPQTGRHVTHEYRVKGPVMIFLTTTQVELDEELTNRCVVLTVNESREQTQLIHQMQREGETLEGQLLKQELEGLRRFQQTVQRLLRPVMVVNGYSRLLTFRNDQTRSRRDHPKYLTMIRAVALLHQYQRPVLRSLLRGRTVEYIEVIREDMRVAHRLAQEVLGRTLDELPPTTRRVLEMLHGWVRERCQELTMSQADFRFWRKDVRAVTGWRETQARMHLDLLVTLEYVVAHRGTQGQSYVYELLYEGQGQDGQPFMLGLMDPDTLPPMSEHDRRLDEERGVGASPGAGEALSRSECAALPASSAPSTPTAPLALATEGVGATGEDSMVALARTPPSSHGYDPNFADEKAHFAGGSRSVRGAFAAGSRVGVDGPKPAVDAELGDTVAKCAKNTVLEIPAKNAVVPPGTIVPVSKPSRGNGDHPPDPESES
jgi:hypothetical protein